MWHNPDLRGVSLKEKRELDREIKVVLTHMLILPLHAKPFAQSRKARCVASRAASRAPS